MQSTPCVQESWREFSPLLLYVDFSPLAVCFHDPVHVVNCHWTVIVRRSSFPCTRNGWNSIRFPRMQRQHAIGAAIGNHWSISQPVVSSCHFVGDAVACLRQHWKLMAEPDIVARSPAFQANLNLFSHKQWKLWHHLIGHLWAGWVGFKCLDPSLPCVYPSLTSLSEARARRSASACMLQKKPLNVLIASANLERMASKRPEMLSTKLHVGVGKYTEEGIKRSMLDFPTCTSTADFLPQSPVQLEWYFRSWACVHACVV